VVAPSDTDDEKVTSPPPMTYAEREKQEADYKAEQARKEAAFVASLPAYVKPDTADGAPFERASIPTLAQRSPHTAASLPLAAAHGAPDRQGVDRDAAVHGGVHGPHRTLLPTVDRASTISGSTLTGGSSAHGEALRCDRHETLQSLRLPPVSHFLYPESPPWLIDALVQELKIHRGSESLALLWRDTAFSNAAAEQANRLHGRHTRPSDDGARMSTKRTAGRRKEAAATAAPAATAVE
jgi:hypothetical protein